MRILLALLLAATALGARVYGLFSTSIWIDDVYTLSVATGHSLDVRLDGMTDRETWTNPQGPMPALYFLAWLRPGPHNNPWRVARYAHATETHPPLFHVLMHLWMRVFGFTMTAGRAFALLCSLAAIPVLFFLARRMAGEDAAWIACFLCALAPLQSQLALQVRMYTLLGLLALATTSLTWQIINTEATPSRVRWLMWLGIAGLLVHYYFVLYAAFQGLALLAARRWAVAAKVAAAWGAVLLALGVYLAVQPGLAAQPWIYSLREPFVLLVNAGGGITDFVVLNAETALGSGRVILFVVLGILLLAASRYPFLLAWMAGPVFLLMFTDWIRGTGTVVQIRYLAGSSFAMYLLLAVGLMRLPRVLRVVLGVALVLLMLSGQAVLRHHPVGTLAEGADYKRAAAEITSGDLVIVHSSYPEAAIALAYYLPPETPILALIHLERREAGSVTMSADTSDVQPRLDRWAAGKRLWVARSFLNSGRGPVDSWIKERYRTASATRYGDLILRKMDPQAQAH